MKEIVDVLATASGSRAEQLAARSVFLQKRAEIWEQIRGTADFPLRTSRLIRRGLLELQDDRQSDATSC